MDERQYVFAQFRLDPVDQQLWREDELVALRPKLFAVLRHLLEHPGRLVTRAELLAAVWPTTVVSESVLRGTIRELRDVLGDDAIAARFIETVPHRGYRFVAAVTTAQPTRPRTLESRHDDRRGAPRAEAAILIGRAAEIEALHQCLERAMRGTRQVVFVSGEPGIGKTALVDRFLASAATTDDAWIVRGQCVEHYGASEAYLPVLEALGQLCRQGGPQVVAVLSRYAPTWLVQMPGLVGDAELEAVQRRAQGATRERMLRELAEAVEALTAQKTLVLTLEDLHWSDVSTLDLVSLLAQRRMPAGLLLIGTYRPADVIVSGHPLKGIKQELRLHQQCEDLMLPFLTDAEVGAYLSERFPERRLPADLARAIHRSTDGNPLFVVSLVDYWLSQGALIESAGEWHLSAPVDDLTASVPDSLRQLIEKQLERLTADECRMLEAAGVVGLEFSTAAVAAALGEPEERVEDWCEGLAGQGRFLLARGMEALANRTATGRYGFIHGLYQQVLYERLAAVRRTRLHHRIGEWGASVFSARAQDTAAKLAMHFERGQDHARAIEYLAHAADNAARRHAPHEAAALLGRALTLLKTLPDSSGRTEHELALLVALGVPLLMTKGYAAQEVERTYARAHELCGQMGESAQLLPALAGLFRFHYVRADVRTARALGEQILRLAQQTQDALVFLVAHSLLGPLFLSLGQFTAAREHLEQGIALYDPHTHRFMASLYGDDPGVTCQSFAAMNRWLLGYPDQALRHAQKALTIAKDTGSPYCETFALDFVTWTHVLRREEHAAQTSIDALMRIAPQHGFQFLLADSQILHSWALAAQGMEAEGLRRIHPAIASYEATGAAMSRPSHLMLLAKVYGMAGQTEEALAAVAAARAVVEQTDERTHDAELYRLQGELTLQGSPRRSRKRQRAGAAVAEAEACFQKALAVARRQQAKSLELRAAMDLCRLWQQQDKRREAHRMLSDVYEFFTEGFDTPDLRDARALLAALA
jgi:DNA-binding winged helix-turn-helix (wHTH) protein/predicted ATPase